ncbi:putative pantothenate kinase [Helianthus annuus]|nr:putative pantothenate kinase [Helianthus annuus]
MASPVGNSIHRSGSRPQLDLSGAAIQGNFEERDPTILLPNQSDDISHLALDIGGHSCVFNTIFLLLYTLNSTLFINFYFSMILISVFENFAVFIKFVTGSLIKLVYFSRHEDRAVNDKRKMSTKERFGVTNGNRRSFPILGGRLHFVKFETTKINECLEFIHSKQLHRGGVILNSFVTYLVYISLKLHT